MWKETKLEISIMTSIEGMTPQQERLFKLQASRPWGPFTDEEAYRMNFETQPRKHPDPQPTDVSDRIRVLEASETLLNIQTKLMPGER
jgi:hypothetical protein